MLKVDRGVIERRTASIGWSGIRCDSTDKREAGQTSRGKMRVDKSHATQQNAARFEEVWQSG